MNKILYAFTLVIYLTAAPSWAQSLQQYSEALAADPTFSHASVGICVMKGNGEEMAVLNSKKMLVPASNMKLISTGAALYSLGPDYRFHTSIQYDGVIDNGTLHGNLYIVGEGDPTLGSKDSIAVDLNTVFAQWEKAVRNAGIKVIKGYVIGDGRWLEGMGEEPTWLYEDLGTYYGTGVTGLMFYENMQSFSVSPGAAEYDPVRISVHYPSCSWMDYRYECTTGAAGTGDKLFLYTSDMAPIGVVRGTFGVDRGSKRVDFSNKFPEYTCAVYFEKYLDGKGVSCTKGAADFRLKNEWRGAKDEDITIIGSTKSPNLKRIALSTNHVSNNLFAETLLRTLGKELLGSTDYEVSRTALNNVLKKMGLDTKSLHVDDGSGLSRQNYVSADFLCSFLKAMMASPAYKDFVYGLPSPGGNGTLQFNMRSYPDELKTRIKAKSGSMNGIRCYSGYVLPSTPGGKTIIFSILTGNCTAPSWKVRQLLDKLMATIAENN
jgi:D-alanyl-D-alanine carboxypeptidase/D-alanyl-D-alanine-endopeptidase (penicillin-binding protein 4)